LGQRLPLTIHATTPHWQRHEVVKLENGDLTVWVKDLQDTARLANVLAAWSRQQAELLFRQRIAALLPCFSEVTRPPDLKIRRMRARWGSCSTNGTVTLNLRLIHLDMALIDYVIMHELCHLIEHNHSKRFYALLTCKMPDWQKRRDQLNAVGMPI
jgi:predicted metal-dependent hydrolase